MASSGFGSDGADEEDGEQEQVAFFFVFFVGS
jgi:hypothetical protein